MKLHEDLALLEQAIRSAAAHLNLPITYVEKDYWVTKALKRLAMSDIGQKVVFKGGTSLSKAYNLISRFSEDVDIAVLTNGLTNSQAGKLVKEASKIASVDLEEIDSPDNSKGSRFRKVRFAYPRIDDEVVVGQITDSLLLEVNSFADPEPHEKMTISSYIADYFTVSGQEDRVAEFELDSFEINVLCTSRTVCEKVMGLVKASYGDDYLDNLNEKIRHIYDVHYLLTDGFTREFVLSNKFHEMIEKVIETDKEAFDTTPWLEQPLTETRLFVGFEDIWPHLVNTYNGDFSKMVVGKKLPSKDMLQSSIIMLFQQLQEHENVYKSNRN